MFSSIRKSNHGVRAYDAEQVVVQSGLSLSASDMNRMTRQGIPISAQNLSDDMLSPGHDGVDPDVPLFARRGVEFSDVYVAQRDARAKVSAAVRAAKSTQSQSSD